MPATWDDTRVIVGEVGDVIAVARRRGQDWFLGAMTDWQPRALEIPLGFLGKGSFAAEVWKDADEADDYPDRLMKEKKSVTASDKLAVKLASAGGCVAVIRPQVQ